MPREIKNEFTGINEIHNRDLFENAPHPGAAALGLTGP